MELASWTTALLFLIGFVSYKQLKSFYEHFVSSTPVIANTWIDFLTWRATDAPKLLKDAYQRYSKNGLPFRLNTTEYIVPTSAFEQVRKQPSSVLNSDIANEESLMLQDFLSHDHTDVQNFVRQDVSRNLDSLIPALVDEISFSTQKCFPPEGSQVVEEDGQSWYTVSVYPPILTMIGCIASRVFMGKRYSRNNKWTRLVSDFGHGIGVQILFVSFIPKFILPYIARFFPTTKRMNILISTMKSDVLALIDKESGEQVLGDEGELVLLPKLVKFVQSRPAYENASKEKTFFGIKGRMFGLIFAAVDTTSITFTQTMYSIVGHPRAEYVEPMMAQIHEVFAKYDGKWNQKALGELNLLDSFIKEVQRLHPISLILANRKVLPKDGITFNAPPDSPGSIPIHIPQGATVQMPLWGIHSDPDVYPNPDAFQGFRFAQDAIPSSQPSDNFIAFGHGRQACPGRHLALVVVKLAAIEFMMNYDWKEIERPKDWHFGKAKIPDHSAKITMRRRERSLLV